MLQLLAGEDAGEGLVRFKRHRPEQTLLYRLIEQYFPDFEMQWASEGRVLPDYVRREFDEYLKCGRLEHGFLRVQCESCHAEHLVAFSCTNSRRFRRTQRFLSQLRRTPHGRKRCLAGG